MVIRSILLFIIFNRHSINPTVAQRIHFFFFCIFLFDGFYIINKFEENYHKKNCSLLVALWWSVIIEKKIYIK